MSATLEQLRELTALQADDAALWDTVGIRIETAYVQQALRLLTRAIEGDISYEDAHAAMREMMP